MWTARGQPWRRSGGAWGGQRCTGGLLSCRSRVREGLGAGGGLLGGQEPTPPGGQALALPTCISPSPLLPLCPQGLARGSRRPVLPGRAWCTSSPHRGRWKLALVLCSNVAVPTPGREGRPSASACTCPPRCDGDAHPQPPADFPESARRAGAPSGRAAPPLQLPQVIALIITFPHTAPLKRISRVFFTDRAFNIHLSADNFSCLVTGAGVHFSLYLWTVSLFGAT